MRCAIGLAFGIAERERAADGTAGTWKGLLAWIGSEAVGTGEAEPHGERASKFCSRILLRKPPDIQGGTQLESARDGDDVHCTEIWILLRGVLIVCLGVQEFSKTIFKL